MEARVNADVCIGCGLCVRLCSAVFEMDFDDEVSHVKVELIPADAFECAKEAKENCPASAISLEGT